MIKDKQKKIEIGTVIRQGTLENRAKSIFLGIGSNLGNKRNNIEKAKFLLIENHIEILKSSNYCFTFRCDDGRNQPLMGNALVLGADDEGESKDVETSIDEIKRRVSFKGHQAIDLGREINLSPIPTILNDDDIARMVKDHD